MDAYLNTFSSISSLVLLISFVSFLRYLKVLKQEDGLLFSKIVTQITLPAVVLSVLSHSKVLEWEYFFVIVVMFFIEIFVLFITFHIGKKLDINRAQIGTLMLVSAFGSSALLGYVVIEQVFPSSYQALSEAVLISELGVGVGLFTVGTIVAIHFGDSSLKQSPLESIRIFLFSPIFLSIVVALAYSFLNISPQTVVIKEIFDTINLIAKANTFFVALTVGVLLQFQGIRSILPLVAIAIILKLLFSPFLIWLASLGMNFTPVELEVIVLEFAMPSAMLSVVLAAKYGCDAILASKLVFITTLFSIITIPLIIGIL